MICARQEAVLMFALTSMSGARGPALSRSPEVFRDQRQMVSLQVFDAQCDRGRGHYIAFGDGVERLI